MNGPEPGGIVWRKSSYSAGSNGCVEVGWRKSSYSGHNGDCVEVAPGDITHIRDTKNRSAGHLCVRRTQWAAFLAGLRHHKTPA
ncbi:MAG: DUF397 domain-containing protein [Pseudonocardiaceae bacterium]|nr:DUF397 domain-containing protein [Pseudonocardiaceae bacterium]